MTQDPSYLMAESKLLTYLRGQGYTGHLEQAHIPLRRVDYWEVMMVVPDGTFRIYDDGRVEKIS